MTDPAILWPVVTALVVALAMLGYGLAQWRVNAGYRRQVDAAARRLAPFLVGAEGLDLAIFDAVGDYGREPVLDVLRSARRQLSGDCSDAIAASLLDLGEVNRLKRVASSPLRRRRLAALWGLGECGGPEALAVLADALSHPDPATRRIARESAMVSGDMGLVVRAIESLRLEDPPAIESSSRFLRWCAVRFPSLVEAELGSGMLAPHLREGLREAVAGTRSLRESQEQQLSRFSQQVSAQQEPDETVFEERLEPEFGRGPDGPRTRSSLGDSIERIIESTGVMSQLRVVDNQWLDARARSLDLTVGLRLVTSEVALGLALLIGALTGGGLAWLFFG